MASHFQEQESLLQNPIFNALYCNEGSFDEDLSCGYGSKVQEIEDFNEIQKKSFHVLFEHELSWEDEELATLLSNEEKQTCMSYEMKSLKMVRNEGINWMLKVIKHYGFAALTAVLAVNYYDRFVTSVCFRKDKPWMSQLTAVACLSIAAKVEETQVPLLLDLQVEEPKYVFEPKTVMRMEILVLSTLKWRMNPVTPISFLDHFVRRFALVSNLHFEFLRRCEGTILAIINDCKFVHYLPSVVAAATMIYVIRESESSDSLDIQNQVMSILRASKVTLDDCLKLIVEAIGDQRQKQTHKRKHESLPRSPNGVIDAYFSSKSSNNSWSVASSVASLPEPLFKRRIAQLSSGTLSDKLNKSNDHKLQEREIRQYTKALLKGLHYIHKFGYVHCDIKLQNILLTSNGAVRIADFGLSKRVGEKESGLRGTPMYMSPEMLTGGDQGPPADIWALGCVVSELSAGVLPWKCSGGLTGVLMRIGGGDESPEISCNLLEQGKDFVRKCFVKNPNERWTAEMLLSHPFVCDDQDFDDGIKISDSRYSPRCPFDFPDWVSSVACSITSLPLTEYSNGSSLRCREVERLREVVSDHGPPDWSCSVDWVTVR